jgi:hypothetical protein
MVATLEHLDRDVRAGGSNTFVVKQGDELQHLELDWEDEIVPEKSRYGCLEFYGMGTEVRKLTWDEKTTEKVDLLIRIIDPEDAQHKGLFRSSVTFESCGPQSTIGQMFTAILGEPFVGKVNNDLWKRVLGGRFSCSLTAKEKGDRVYTNIVHGSPLPAKTKKAAAAKTAPAANPFDDDEE